MAGHPVEKRRERERDGGGGGWMKGRKQEKGNREWDGRGKEEIEGWWGEKKR